MEARSVVKKRVIFFVSFSLIFVLLDHFFMSDKYFGKASAAAVTGDRAEELISVAWGEIGFRGVDNHRNKYTLWCGKVDPTIYPDGGYGYEWCQAFVGYCANRAGISTEIIPRAPGTYTCKSFFVKKGLWHNSRYHGGTYSPKRGDLVYFQWNGKSGAPSHVGIVTGASAEKLYTIEGNTGYDQVLEREYDIGSSVIQGYCTPAYTDLYSGVPTYSLLSADKTAAAVNEEITFSASSDRVCGYTIGIANSQGRCLTREMPDGRLTLRFSEPGSYSAYVTSYTPNGYCDSAWITFGVYGSKPNTAVLSADKTVIGAGDQITFSASSDIPAKYTIGAADSGGRYLTQEMPGGTLSLKFDKPGRYSAYVTAYNSFGYADSKWISFEVRELKPSKSYISADKSKAFVGQTITFTAASDIAAKYTIGVDSASGRIVTREMPNGALSLSFDKAGEYSAYVTAYNSNGYADSQRVFFTVYDAAPSYSVLACDRTSAAVNEPISFTAASDLASEYCIGIDCNGRRLITELMPNGKISLSFTTPGTYSAYVTSANKYGYKDSRRVTFTVYAK